MLPCDVEDHLLEPDPVAPAGDELGKAPEEPGERRREQRHHHQHPAGDEPS
jgi:hypothetical protein